MINTFLNNYFGFNRQQRNGLLLLIGISFLLLVIRLVYPYFIKPDQMIIKNLNLITTTADSLQQKKEGRGNYPEKKLTQFDPNTVTYNEMIALGFPAKTAKALQNFRHKGFKFSTKEDLLKVYGVSDSFFAEIGPYILIKGSAAKTTGKGPEQSGLTQPVAKVELNSADSLTLVKVKGIGPAFAKRILKYREILGGYTSVDQLKEVYGLTEEHFLKMKDGVSVNAELVRKININHDDFKVINKHPYISYEQTKLLCNFRQKTPLSAGNLADALNDATLASKLMPYLAFN